uniref:hypothetical protein n=1 Tax=Pseudomonas sp. EL_65y_Pfl2_R95 TaxID=3088698 RepID=UPI0030DC9CD3
MSVYAGHNFIDLFLRPVCYQNFLDSQLPLALQNANPLGPLRRIYGRPNRESIA